MPVRAADMRRLTRELQKPLRRFRNEIGLLIREAQIHERRAWVILARLSAHAGAIGAVAAAAAARASSRAGRLLPSHA